MTWLFAHESWYFDNYLTADVIVAIVIVITNKHDSDNQKTEKVEFKTDKK